MRHCSYNMKQTSFRDLSMLFTLHSLNRCQKCNVDTIWSFGPMEANLTFGRHSTDVASVQQQQGHWSFLGKEHVSLNKQWKEPTGLCLPQKRKQRLDADS